MKPVLEARVGLGVFDGLDAVDPEPDAPAFAADALVRFQRAPDRLRVALASTGAAALFRNDTLWHGGGAGAEKKL